MPDTDAPLHGEPLPIEFMNTLWSDRDSIHDSLASSAKVSDWLGAVRGHSRHRLTEADARDARGLRDALRSLAVEATSDQRPAASPVVTANRAITIVNANAALAPSWPQLHWPRTGMPYRSIHSGGALAAATLSEIARHAVDLFGGPDRELLRPCYAPGCLLYFMRDHPRREWCSAVCGNRARVARHYQRHRND